MSNGKTTNGTNSYQALLQKFEPRPIANEVQYDEAQYDTVVGQLNLLLDQSDLTSAEQEMLTLLGTLVMAYEDEHYSDEKFTLRGLPLLKSLMAEAALQEEDLLSVFQTKLIVTSVLRGQQLPTAEQLDKLATFFGLPRTLFENEKVKEPA